MKLGVGMMPKMDNYTALEGLSLGPLMDGVHTKEAIEMVRVCCGICTSIALVWPWSALPHPISFLVLDRCAGNVCISGCR